MKDFKLTDLEGIGPTKAKRLENSGITSPMDFVIRGAKEISRITDITVNTSLKLLSLSSICLSIFNKFLILFVF